MRLRGSRRRGRSIPAYAGEPQCAGQRAVHATVYPRVCGGTDTRASKAITDPGLSPRMRGNLFVQRVDKFTVGSIPAYAGEPAARHTRPPQSRVYPRVCGGTAGTYRRPANVHGLSPRMRGNPPQGTPGRRNPGSIPAYAGEPPAHTAARPTCTVYPRVCGGTVDANIASVGDEGLSPRMRGNPFR